MTGWIGRIRGQLRLVFRRTDRFPVHQEWPLPAVVVFGFVGGETCIGERAAQQHHQRWCGLFADGGSDGAGEGAGCLRESKVCIGSCEVPARCAGQREASEGDRVIKGMLRLAELRRRRKQLQAVRHGVIRQVSLEQSLVDFGNICTGDQAVRAGWGGQGTAGWQPENNQKKSHRQAGKDVAHAGRDRPCFLATT